MSGINAIVSRAIQAGASSAMPQVSKSKIGSLVAAQVFASIQATQPHLLSPVVAKEPSVVIAAPVAPSNNIGSLVAQTAIASVRSMSVNPVVQASHTVTTAVSVVTSSALGGVIASQAIASIPSMNIPSTVQASSVSTAVSQAQSQCSNPGYNIFEHVLKQSAARNHAPAPVSRGEIIASTAVHMAQQKPALVQPKAPTPMKPSPLMWGLYILTGTSPKTVGEEIKDRVVASSNQGQNVPKTTEQQVVEQAIFNQQQAQSTTLSALTQNSVVTPAVSTQAIKNESSLFQNAIMIGIVAALSFVAIKALWNKFIKPHKEEITPPAPTSKIAVIEEPLEIDEGYEATGGNDSEEELSTKNSSKDISDTISEAEIVDIVEEPAEISQAIVPVTSEKCVIQDHVSTMSVQQLEQLRAFILLMNSFPALREFYIRKLHQHLLLTDSQEQK